MRERGIEFVYVPYPWQVCRFMFRTFVPSWNLLDNAIEGVARIKPAPTSPSIRLAFSRSWDMFYIYCENPCNTETIVKRKTISFLPKQKTEPVFMVSVCTALTPSQIAMRGVSSFILKTTPFMQKVVLPYLNERGKYQ